MWKYLQGWASRPNVLIVQSWNAGLVSVPIITTHCLLQVWPDILLTVRWSLENILSRLSASKSCGLFPALLGPTCLTSLSVCLVSALIYNSFVLWKAHEITSTWKHVIQDALDPCSQAMATHLWLRLPLEKRSEFLCWYVSTYKKQRKEI